MAWVEIDGDRRQYAQSWAVSLFAHGMILTAAVTFVADLKFVPPQERFRWDVSVVEPPQPEQTQEAAQPPASQTEPSPPQPVQQEATVQPQPVVETVRHVVQREVREVKPLQQVTRTSSEAALVTRVIPSTSTPQETAAVVQQTQLVAETASAAPPATQSAPSAVEVSAVTHAKSVVEAVQGPEGAVQQASIKELPVRSAPSTRPDYGWLMEALWRQVDRLKRYPHTARVNRWEGKVVLRAVIREDGQVVELSVEESSGYTILDRDALEILKQASPLKLKHPLGQAQVVVHVPISYKLQ